MKVLVLSSLYPNNMFPTHGIFIKERITNLIREVRCDIRVIAPVPYFPPIKVTSRWKYSQVDHLEIRDNLQVFHPRFFMTPKIGMPTYGWLMYKSILPLIKKIRAEFDFDLIDAHYMYPDCFAAVLLGRFFKKPVVVTARGSDINQFTNFPVVRKLLSYTLKKADHCVAVSKALKYSMVRLGVAESKISVIPNGVDPRKFHPLDRQETRKNLGLAKGKVILSVGNLIPLKGFDILIKAFKQVHDSRPDSKLTMLIVGEGQQRSELLTLIRDLSLTNNVHLIGAKLHHELNAYYNAADVFCLASSREGWPNVIMESLACGTPVIATGVGGIPEIISSGDVGLISERTEDAFAKNIHEALNKTWDVPKIVDFAHQFTWHKAARSISDTFERIV